VRMAKDKMWFSPAKAIRELGLPQTPPRQALADAVAWFRANGYVVRHHRALMSSPSEPLHLNEVGAYGDLAARPNPSGFVILSVPPFEQMTSFIAQRLGRELTPAEIEIERKKAPSIVLTKEAAEQMAAARAKRG